MPLSVGDKLGHYEVLSLLGQGGMGQVYRARAITLQRDVALEVPSATFLRDPERFHREAQVLASLDHPNIEHIHRIVDSEDARGLMLALIEQDGRICVAGIARLYKDIGKIYAAAVQRSRAQHRCAGGANGDPQNDFLY